MTSQDTAEGGGTLIIPKGEKITFRSELFDVVVRSKHHESGVTRDRYLINVELLDNDPLLERTVLLEVPQDTYDSVSVGERAMARMYEQPDRRWTSRPPSVLP